MSMIIIDDVEQNSQGVFQEEPPKEEYLEIEAHPIYLMSHSVKIDMGGGIYKEISYEDFLNILSSSTGEVITKSSQEFSLPEGCFYFGLNNDTLTVMCYYKESIKPFQYQRERGVVDTFDIVTPNIVVTYRLKKDAHKDKEWVMADEPRYLVTNLPVNKLPNDTVFRSPAPQQGLVLMPFTNAYTDCKMCYGDNRMPSRFTDNNLRGLNYYYSFLWSTPFNNDLGIRDKVVDYDIIGWYELLKQCAIDKSPFPYRYLRGLSVL